MNPESLPHNLVLDQLKRVQASEIFQATSRHRELLCLIVEKTLSGNISELKGPLIADKFFRGRDDIVRVEVGRLRRMLEAYYLKTPSDLLRIEIPKGAYRAKFSREHSVKPQQNVAEGSRPSYVTEPSLPRNYVYRAEAIESLRDIVTAQNEGPNIALTALWGMGGIGKTVLAQALCRDEVVRRRFPDGIVWVSIGRESKISIVEQMREVAKVLDDRLNGDEMTQGCMNWYRTMMQNKSALVVLDDVWRASDLDPFVAESPRSHLLFTTQRARLFSSVGAQEYRADWLTEDESRKLFATSSNCFPLWPEADALITECGRHPLALSMIGAMVRGKPRSSWKHVHKLIQEARLDKIAADLLNYPHDSLLRAMKVSVDALGANERERYLALAIWLEDVCVHPAIQQQLWNLDELEAAATAEEFANLSLAQSDGVTGAISLHDLHLDYLRAVYPDQHSLILLRSTVRLSRNVFDHDPSQFASQMLGRLLGGEFPLTVQHFVASLARGNQLSLRPLRGSLEMPGTALIRTLDGHSKGVNGVAITPDDRRAVSASDDNTLKVWNLDTGLQLQTLLGHSNSVQSVAISLDGRRAVSASWDRTLKVWDLETGIELFTLQGHSSYVSHVVITPESRRAVSGSGDGTIKVWDLETGVLLITLIGHTQLVTTVAITPDGRGIVSGSLDRTIRIWDLETGQERRQLQISHSGLGPIAVAGEPGGTIRCLCGAGRMLKMWDLDTARELLSLEGHEITIMSVAITPDGRTAVSSSMEGGVIAWDLTTGRQLATLKGHSDLVMSVAITSDGRRAVSASWDRTLKVWNLDSSLCSTPSGGYYYRVNAIAAASDRLIVVSASWDTTLKVWCLRTGDELRTLRGHRGRVHDVAVTPDGLRAVSASEDNTLKVWDLESGCEMLTLVSHTKPVIAVAIASDGRTAMSAIE